jgi:hypothetical protein
MSGRIYFLFYGDYDAMSGGGEGTYFWDLGWCEERPKNVFLVASAKLFYIMWIMIHLVLDEMRDFLYES